MNESWKRIGNEAIKLMGENWGDIELVLVVTHAFAVEAFHKCLGF